MANSAARRTEIVPANLALPMATVESREGSRRMWRDSDLWTSSCLALALAMTNTVWAGGPPIWRFIAGLLVGVVLPGHSFISWLFPRRSDLDEIERWGLSLIFSVVLVILDALILSLVHVRLTTASVTWSLSGLVVILSALSAVRRRAVPRDELYRFRGLQGRAPWLTLALAAALALTTWIVVAANLRAAQPEFSITDPTGRLSGYPFEVRKDTHYPLQLQIGNPTPDTLVYRLVTTNGRGSTISTQAIRVAAHGRWSQTVVLPSGTPSTAETLTFTLYRGREASRKLWIRYRVVS
jgi:uncharacterized membrane protein